MAEDGARRPVAFISHHSSQEKTARHLKTVLERNGVTGWMAPDDIEPGVAFDQAIIEQVKRSDLIVLLFCARSDQSRHVKREVMLAEDNNKLIYPVRLEDIDAKGLAYWLNDYQWVDWIDRRDATIQKMIETIKRQVGAQDAAKAPPAEADAAEVPAEAKPSEPEPADKAAEEETKPAAEEPKTPEKTEAKEPDAKVPEAKAPAAAKPAPAPAAPPPTVAKPAPADTTPMGLAGSPPAGGSGSGGIGAAMAGLGRNAWIAIGAGAVLLAVLLGLAVNSFTGGEDSEFYVRPGEWSTSYEFDRTLVNRRFSAAEAENLVNTIDSRSATQCIYEDDASDPGDDFFDPQGADNCTAQSIEMEDGRFRARLQCFPTQLQGERMDVWMRGTYDWEEIQAEAEYAVGAGTPREFRFVTNETKRHIGGCD